MPRKDLKLLLALSFFLFLLLLAVPVFAFSSAYGLNLGQSLGVGIDFVGSHLQHLGLALRGLSRSNLMAELVNPQYFVGFAALVSLLLAFRSARAAFLSEGKRARRVAASAAGLQLWLSGTLLLTLAVEPGLETAVKSQGRIASQSQKSQPVEVFGDSKNSVAEAAVARVAVSKDSVPKAAVEAAPLGYSCGTIAPADAPEPVINKKSPGAAGFLFPGNAPTY